MSVPVTNLFKKYQIHACYLHSCLKYVTRDYLTNASLRERFGLDSKSSATVSRIIKDSLEKGVVKLKDPETAPRYYKPELFISFLYKCGAPHSITIIAI